ncbi:MULTISPECIES: DUF423 domain-containing protein [Jeotgalicoccus]|jgi:Uncharacterized small membrane protein|uniref:DUF423 domain-containing protein n=1 Tax=Jeotgalicoccus nanhaiensis TaxID=568603 RepID=A0ABR9XZK0_9STAP|nr:DUF423 domain-containing protein [Jeotgalicoccus nanhaiensis]MBF0754414.1 DUF423 domain-containing protein [Jeotgalicoccus nanhaiensis]TFU61120.1 DUF423 domain-containing protein [Jeotgalicoccus nanhaiensis]
MLVFIIVGAVFFILSFVFGRYRKKLRKEHIKAWNKALKYMRYTSLALIIAGLLYVPEVQILKFGGWLFIFSLILYSSSLYLIFIKNREKSGGN